MSDAGDIPRIPKRKPRQVARRRRVFAVVFVLLAFLILSLFRGVATFYTDYLWFGSVHLTSVWSGLLWTKIWLGLAAVAFIFVVLWINLWIADRSAPKFVVAEDEFVRQFQMVTRSRAGLVRTAIALVISLFAGVGFYKTWNHWLLFKNGGNFGTTDPQFHKDIGFFVFKLPFLTDLVNWVFSGFILAVIVSLAAHYLQGNILPQASTNKISHAVKMHISILFGILALIRAAYYFLDRYRLSYSTRGPDIVGANYTDVHFLLPALTLLILISVLAAVLFFVGARSKGWSWPAITVGLWFVVLILVGVIIPAAVQKFSVDPAESKKESPYIQRNINATRDAQNITNVAVDDFKYTDNLTATDLQANASTVRNIRLWDPTLLLPSYKRLQESRSFFQFTDIDIDRYALNGDETQTMLAVRELNPSGLPNDRKSWVNQHLAYTHGYGAVSSPANAVTSDGGPNFTVKDLPPVGTPTITQPQIYFGETTNDYSIVNTNQGEVDYTNADGRDQTSSYVGSGGVKLNSIVTKAAFAARVGNINPLISGLVKKDSRAMYLTDIREREVKAAPFLQYDQDPYPILLDGRIQWMQDAYTTTNYYPYGEKSDTGLVESGKGDSLKTVGSNYIRNSVKVVTDAYNGNMTFYVMDNKDPVIKAWQKAFPKLFTDGSKMPDGLRQHIRYPEDLFRVQSKMFGSYHLTNAQDFYSKSDRWNIAQKPADSGTTAATTEGTIDPYYLLMKLPNESDLSFLMFQPFVPFSTDNSRKELSAFMVAKSDPAHYGQMSAYVMPRDQQIDGPALVEARIQQDPTISQYVTLLDRAGSKVDYGNMSIVPIDNSLLYVRPLYVESAQTKVPEFKKAIVVQGPKIAMEDTLQEALEKIFGSAPATLEQPKTPGSTAAPGATTTAPTTGLSDNAAALLDQANAEFAAADTSLKAGDLSGYQQHIQNGAALVKQARGQ